MRNQVNGSWPSQSFFGPQSTHEDAYTSTGTSSHVTSSPSLIRLNQDGHCIAFRFQDLVPDDPGVILLSCVALKFLPAINKRLVEFGERSCPLGIAIVLGRLPHGVNASNQGFALLRFKTEEVWDMRGKKPYMWLVHRQCLDKMAFFVSEQSPQSTRRLSKKAGRLVDDKALVVVL